MSARDDDFAEDPLDRRISTLVAATADESDPRIAQAVQEVLRLVRNHMDMDIAFVSEFVDGRRVFRHVDAGENDQLLSVGASDPLAQSFCQRIVDGRLPQLVRDVASLPNFDELPATPFSVGAHLSTAIVLEDGHVYGTLCCFSFAPDESLTQRHLKRLQMAARMVARLIDKAQAIERGH